MMAYQGTRPGDSQTMLTAVYPNGRWGNQPDKTSGTGLFTDRGLYRPDKTCILKGIAYTNTTDKPHAIEGETFKVTLRGCELERSGHQRVQDE